MCTFERAFDGTTRDQIRDATLTKDPERIPDRYSKKLWRICESMLEKDVSERSTLRDILTMQIIVDNAKAQLPADIFATEFPQFVSVEPVANRPNKKADTIAPDQAQPALPTAPLQD